MNYRKLKSTTLTFGLTCALYIFSLFGLSFVVSDAEAQQIGTWTHCADERRFCYFSGTRQVRMGAGTQYKQRTLTARYGVYCSTRIFGDAAPGQTKHCEILSTNSSSVSSSSRSNSLSSSSPSSVISSSLRSSSVSSISRSSSISSSSRSSFVSSISRSSSISLSSRSSSSLSSSRSNSSSTSTPSGNDYHPTGYSLDWSDEFSASQLDRSHWCTRYIYGGGATPQVPDSTCQQNGEGTLDFLNDEQQRYVDTNLSGETMHVQENGALSLRATRTRPFDSWAAYESAMIRSKRTFKPSSQTSYYVTARVRLPNVRGTWPALWLNSDRDSNGSLSWPPEIDIFEGALNEIEDTEFMLHQNAILNGSNPGLQTSSRRTEVTWSASDFDRTWMNYHASRSLRNTWIEVGAEWTSTGVCYFVDGYKTMCENYRWVVDSGAAAAPAHLLINLAIGGQWAGRHGIADAKFPTRMEIDYVRVYKK